jgi:DNA-binding NarL/FixJ family response regulator
MTRVLMGDFRALARVGLEELLREQAVELLATAETDLLERLMATLPDVVVLDLDAEHSDELAHRIATDYPAVRLIACSIHHPTMRVYPAFHAGEWYECELDIKHFTAAIKA